MADMDGVSVGDQKPCLTQRRIGTSQGDCCRCVVAAGDLPPPLLPVIRSPRKSPPRASAPWSRLWLGVMGSPFRATVWVIRVKKVKVPELVPVLGSQPAGDVSHKAAGRLPLLSRRQVEISVGRPQTLHGNVHQVDTYQVDRPTPPR